MPSEQSGGRCDRPRGSLVAPDGSPGPSECVFQDIDPNLGPLPLFRDVLRVCLQDPASCHHGTLIRRTMMPFAPMPSSAWLRGPNIGSKPPTKWLRKAPRPFRPFLARRLPTCCVGRASTSADVRCPRVIAQPRPLHPRDPLDARHRFLSRSACRLDVGRATHHRRAA